MAAGREATTRHPSLVEAKERGQAEVGEGPVPPQAGFLSDGVSMGELHPEAGDQPDPGLPPAVQGHQPENSNSHQGPGERMLR